MKREEMGRKFFIFNYEINVICWEFNGLHLHSGDVAYWETAINDDAEHSDRAYMG